MPSSYTLWYMQTETAVRFRVNQKMRRLLDRLRDEDINVSAWVRRHIKNALRERFPEEFQQDPAPESETEVSLEETPTDNGNADAKKTNPAADPAEPPITARQKDLLGKLVEQQPELARELGINPDKPELEKLSKRTATPLIGKTLDRLKDQGIRLMNS